MEISSAAPGRQMPQIPIAFRSQFKSSLRWFQDILEPRATEGEDDHTTIFMEDFFEPSGCRLNPKTRLEFVQPKCRGLVAKAAINADELLITIPRARVLTVENALKSGSELAQEYSHILKPLEDEPWLSLILVMMFEKLNKSGQWAPCFYVAPHEFDTLIWWNDEELSELQASAVVDKIGRVEADAMFKEKLLPIVVANKRLFRYEIRRDGTEEEWERALLHEAHLMASTIMAYGFDLEPEYRDVDEDGYATEEDDADLPKAIVPMADMLNADADKNNARLFYEDGQLVMKALAPIATGEEIFNDYGNLPRSDLLRRYGYITPNYAQYDVVEVSFDLVISTIRDLCRSGHIEEPDDLEHNISSIDVDLSDRIDVPRPQGVENLVRLFADFIILLNHLLPAEDGWLEDEGRMPAIWVTVLIEVIKRRQAQYATTLDQDREILKSRHETLSRDLALPASRRAEGAEKEALEQLLDAHFTLKRKIMATEVRIGEKEILQDALNWLRDFQNTADQNKRRKRQRVE